ncbi:MULTISPECIES: DUF3999 family protein [unclassified Sphingobacterium]|uniref:DUF3999 family protein n=1 Tax=unclassified Sphingobacterium TaxID=2609468 RepID=UPI0025E777BD|nr:MULTISPECIES: DUF3999 family protein [unclassified Sphingobacterium]
MKRIVSVFLCSLLAVIQVYGQQYSATLEGNKKEGYYQFKIPAGIRSIIGNDISKIRIRDNGGQEVPFVKFVNASAGDKFLPLTIVKKEIIADSVTTLIIRNTKQETWTSLSLRIANSNSSKRYTLTGSNDSVNWFSLSENQLLDNLVGSGQTFKDQEITFPLNNYRYLKIIIWDKGSSPINVLEVGRYESIKTAATYQPVQGVKFDMKSENKNSILHVMLPDFQIIDYVSLSVSDPKLYQRKVAVLASQLVQVKRNRWEDQLVEIGQYELSPANTHMVVPSLFVKDFYIQIENLDSPPLRIDSISLGQTALNIVTNLAAGKQYSIVIDSAYKAPDYDLSLFKNNASDQLPVLTVSKLKPIKPGSGAIKNEAWKNTFGNILLWGGMVIAIIVICYFAIGFLKDVNKK